MTVSERAYRNCPWLEQYSSASYATEALVRFLGGPLGFASSTIRRLFCPRSGFTLCTPRTRQFGQGRLQKDGLFMGAVLAKLVQRGQPSPCSLALERTVLRQAQEAGVLEFDERSDTGEFRFSCRPRLPRFQLMVTACLLPELLIEDEEINGLLDMHRSLCTEPEKEFLDQLVAGFPDPRLALFVLPQRQMGSMLVPTVNSSVADADRVDFAVEIPFISEDKWLKVAIEIDDESHTGVQKQQDEQRDKALNSAQWNVLRFPLHDRANWDTQTRQLIDLIHNAVPEALVAAAQELRSLSPELRKAVQGLILLPVAEAQILTAVAELLGRQGVGHITIEDRQQLGLGVVVQSAGELLDHLSSLHNIEASGILSLCDGETNQADITYFGIPSPAVWDSIPSSNSVVVAPRCVSSNYVEPLRSAKPRPIILSSTDRRKPAQESLLYLLQNVFRKVEFRDGQVDIIDRALTLRPTVGLLPTAAGKSLCYQLVSLMEPGFTLVIDPLRSLMLDQQENLEAMGIHRCLAIMSGLEATEIADRQLKDRGYRSVEMGHQLFVFVAPERLQMPDFRDRVKSFSANVPIPYCVVDEAHCVSEWGHDFRPAYLNVGRLVRDYCEHDGSQPSLLAITGTASRNVIIDIMRELEIDDQEAIVEPKSFDRKELVFEIHKVSAQDRLAVVTGKVRSILAGFGWRPGQPTEMPSGLIFTYFVNGNLGVAWLVEELRARLGLPLGMYSGKAPYGMSGTRLDWERMKLNVQRRFKRDELPILACTQAFGMGIDKPNIRFTLHVMLPRSLEEFYQQSGRAGRDQRDSRCIIIFADDQPALADELLDTERTSLEEIEAKVGKSKIPRGSRGDAIRDTWFLTNSFLGRRMEKDLLRYVISEILLPCRSSHSTDTMTFDVSFAALPARLLKNDRRKKVKYEDKSTALEKTLYRLLQIGAISDYMKDFSAKKFRVDLSGVEPQGIYAALENYLRRYAPQGEVQSFLPSEPKRTFQDAACDCGCTIIDYIYNTIEKRRRRAIGQMLQAARDGATFGPEKFREELLAYLEESKFTKPVKELSSHMDPEEWFHVLSLVTGIDDITKLVGACRRQLEDSPSHPGLLLLEGLCLTATPNPEQGFRDLRGGFIALQRNYPEGRQRVPIAMQFLAQAQRLAPSKLNLVLQAILEGDRSLDMARVCYLRAGTDTNAHHLAVSVLMQAVLGAVQQKGVTT